MSRLTLGVFRSPSLGIMAAASLHPSNTVETQKWGIRR